MRKKIVNYLMSDKFESILMYLVFGSMASIILILLCLTAYEQITGTRIIRLN